MARLFLRLLVGGCKGGCRWHLPRTTSPGFLLEAVAKKGLSPSNLQKTRFPYKLEGDSPLFCNRTENRKGHASYIAVWLENGSARGSSSPGRHCGSPGGQAGSTGGRPPGPETDYL